MTDRDNREAEIMQGLVNSITQYQERMGISLSAVGEQATIMQRNVDLIFNESALAALKNAETAFDILGDSLLALVNSKAFDHITDVADTARHFGNSLSGIPKNFNFDSIQAIANSLSSIDFSLYNEETDNVHSDDIFTNLFEEEPIDKDESFKKASALKRFIILFVELSSGYKLDPSDDNKKIALVALINIAILFGPPLLILGIEQALTSEKNIEQKSDIEIAQKQRSIEQTDILIEQNKMQIEQKNRELDQTDEKLKLEKEENEIERLKLEQSKKD